MPGTLHEVEAKPMKSEVVTPRSQRPCKVESSCSPGAALQTPTVAASPGSAASSAGEGSSMRTTSAMEDDETRKAKKKT